MHFADHPSSIEPVYLLPMINAFTKRDCLKFFFPSIPNYSVFGKASLAGLETAAFDLTLVLAAAVIFKFPHISVGLAW